MTASAHSAASPDRAGVLKVTQWRVIASEWVKFRSLRSTVITLLVAVVLTIGLGALITWVTATHWDTAGAAQKAAFNATVRSLAGVDIAQLAVGVLGVLLISAEYATGTIRATLTVVPRRLPVLWAKLVVFIVVIGLVCVAAAIVAFFLGQQILATHRLQVGIAGPHVLRMVLGAGIYMLLVGIIGMALGGIVRNTAAGISALVALIFVIPPVMHLLPSDWANHIGPYLPSTAGTAFWGNPQGTHLAPLAGFLVLCAWAAVATAIAAICLSRQDA